MNEGKKIIDFHIQHMAAGKNNIQDLVLNNARKGKMSITVYLTNGVPLRGRVISFDNFTVVIDNEGKQSLVYKHAISTIIFPEPMSFDDIPAKESE